MSLAHESRHRAVPACKADHACPRLLEARFPDPQQVSAHEIRHTSACWNTPRENAVNTGLNGLLQRLWVLFTVT